MSWFNEQKRSWLGILISFWSTAKAKRHRNTSAQALWFGEAYWNRGISASSLKSVFPLGHGRQNQWTPQKGTWSSTKSHFWYLWRFEFEYLRPVELQWLPAPEVQCKLWIFGLHGFWKDGLQKMPHFRSCGIAVKTGRQETPRRSRWSPSSCEPKKSLCTRLKSSQETATLKAQAAEKQCARQRHLNAALEAAFSPAFQVMKCH